MVHPEDFMIKSKHPPIHSVQLPAGSYLQVVLHALFEGSRDDVLLCVGGQIGHVGSECLCSLISRHHQRSDGAQDVSSHQLMGEGVHVRR